MKQLVRVVHIGGFGDFQMQLADFDGSELYYSIPDFHNTAKRLEKFNADVAEDVMGRCAEVEDEIEYIKSVEEKASAISKLFYGGEWPVRVTHNDTKANNVIFHRETKEPLAVIDLDTVMPGMAGYDFGDAVRFICSDTTEDEPDLSKVNFNLEKFRAFTEGFVGEVKNSLEEKELDTLVDCAFDVTVELGSRFLDDYITGDHYFIPKKEKHNYYRAKCQLALARDIDRKREEMNRIVKEVLNK